MATQIEISSNRLLGENGLGATNINVFPGTNRDSTAEQIATQINKAISLIESGQFEDVDFSDDVQ